MKTAKGGKLVRYKTLLAPALLVFACAMACNTVTERTTSPRLRIAIRPPVPKTADQLECLVYRESAENVYEYTWDLDNVVVAPAGSDAPHVVPSSETLTGQTWRCFVTERAPDGATRQAQATVTIVNSPPRITSVTIEPNTATTDTTLTCSARAIDDDLLDNNTTDATTESSISLDYLWTNGETEIAEATLPESRTTKDQVWTCSVTADDGTTAGEAGIATITIANTPPAPPEVRVEPANPSPSDDLECIVVTHSVDRDGDEVAYRFEWTDGGATHTGSTLPSNHTQNGGRWTCSATPYETGSQATGTPGRTSVEVCPPDLNQDDFPDIILSNYDPQEFLDAHIYWGTPNGYTVEQRIELPTLGATQAAVADLNGDRFVDIVFSNAGNAIDWSVDSYIYWGSADGFSTENRTGLPTHGAWDVAIDDLNLDGHLDIVFANTRTEETIHLNSVIYWGNADGVYSEANSTGLPTHAPLAVTVSDLDQNGFPDLIFANGCGPSIEGRDNFYCYTPTEATTTIYWGFETGFSPENTTGLPTINARDVAVADVNDDTYVDVIIGCGSTQDRTRVHNAVVYWGSANGFDPGRRRELLTARDIGPACPENDCGVWEECIAPNLSLPNETNCIVKNDNLPIFGVGVGDLDGDTHPDILLSKNSASSGGPTDSLIYWGPLNDSSRPDPAFPTKGAMGNTIHDLDRDGYPEVLFANHERLHQAGAAIYWNDEGNFSEPSRTELPTNTANAVTVAGGCP